MTGFSLSPDEVATVCRRMAAGTDSIPGHADRVRGSAVGGGDFGRGHEDVARQYARTVSEVIPRLLGAYGSACQSMAGGLERMLGAFAAAEDDAVTALGEVT